MRLVRILFENLDHGGQLSSLVLEALNRLIGVFKGQLVLAVLSQDLFSDSLSPCWSSKKSAIALL
jgi:hypothetical protein